jgi:hypothetical protein
MKRTGMYRALVGALFLLFLGATASAETKQEYENRARAMMDFAVRMDGYVRSHLGDKKLAAYAQAMAEKNATEAEKMTPPAPFSMLHPHLLLALENIERCFYFAAKGDIPQYRRHQKMVRKELQLVEALAEREHLDLYIWGRRY